MRNSGASASAARGRLSRPEVRERHGHQREDELDRHVLRVEQARLAGRQAAAEVEHRQQQEAVRDDEGGGGARAGHGLAAGRRREADRLPHRPRGDTRRHVVRDVERLDVPGVALLEPVGQAVDDDQQDHQLGRQQQRAGDDEEDRRMEDAAAVEVEREELRDRGQHGESREAAPVDRLDVVGREQDPERRRCDDRRPVEPRRRRQRSDQRPAQPRRPASGLDRCCAHGLPSAEAAEVTAAVAAGTS